MGLPMQYWNNLSLSIKILLGIGVALFVMLVSLSTWAVYTEKKEILFRAESQANTTLDMLEAVHVNAMLNRQQIADNDPVISTLHGTLEQFSKVSDEVKVWVVMDEKTIAYQKAHNHAELEGPLDEVDEEVLQSGQPVFRIGKDNSVRLTRPVIMGQGSAANERCAECHIALMGAEKGQVFGAYSTAVDISKDILIWQSNIIKRTAFNAIIVLFTLALIQLLLFKTLIKPITKITETTEAVARGDKQTRIATYNRQDVIGKLSHALQGFQKAMATRHKFEVERARTQELAHANNELEERVNERTEQLDKALRDAEQANQAKSEFLATMSHEMRTPMNGVIGMTEVVLQGDLEPDQQEKIDMIRFSAESLMVVLNDVLDFTKIEAGEMEVSNQPFKLDDLIRQTVKLWKKPACEKGLEFNIDYEGDTDVTLSGDKARLAQILSNLISNAIKFTDAGHVRLNVLTCHAGDHAALELRVEDTGPGIDRSMVGEIFKLFTQGDQTMVRNHGGTGIGLAICAKLAKLMGGTLKYDGAYEDGACFVLKLALDKVKSEPVSMSQNSPARSKRRLKLLMVEDNALNRKVLCAILEKMPFDLSFAHDGVEAVKIASAQRFDVILMDIQMPNMDGVDATRAIRDSGGPNAATAIIATTANAMREDQDRYKLAGMDDFVAKPINANLLFKAIKKAAKQKKQVFAKQKSA